MAAILKNNFKYPYDLMEKPVSDDALPVPVA
jgi:hypothetical protein